MSDELTAVLAIIGAATGVTSAISEGVRTYRERSRLRLKVDVQALLGKPPRILIHVTNDSPRATTVREVGLYAHPVRIEIGGHGEERRKWNWAEIDFPFNEEPTFMEAYETRAFAALPDLVNYHVHADAPLRVYVIDGRNRRIWGSAAPYVRFALGDDPPLEESDDEEMKWALTPDGKERRPWPVEPRWKVWKRRDLRRSTEESRKVSKVQKAVGTIRVRGGVIRFDPDEKPVRRSEVMGGSSGGAGGVDS